MRSGFPGATPRAGVQGARSPLAARRAGGVPVHTLSEGQMAAWRGRNLGIIFQFFQLLPALTIIENVMLPMDFCKMRRRPTSPA
jgi:ABC-type lipoprotein export system ATPase subunit